MHKRLIVILLFVVAAALTYQYMRPLPAVSAIAQIKTSPRTTPIDLPWPSTGQAAIGAEGYGVLSSHNASSPAPIASITKVITALAVLKQKPLDPGAQGPLITLDSTDLDYFNYYYLHDGSVANVQPGEKITEYQALQGMLLPSANNLADSLARWAFGSVDNYVKYANIMVRDLGLSHTTVGSANGFSDKTTSTAEDLVRLGELAMNDPVVADIVGQSSAELPVAGTVKNVNWLLGADGIEGIKTGNTDGAGGCYLFAAKRAIAGHDMTVIGAILGQPDLLSAISAARPLLQATGKGFTEVKAIQKNDIFGYYAVPWGDPVPIKASMDVSLLVWRGADVKILNEPLDIMAPAQAGAYVGKVTAQSSGQKASSALVLSKDLHGPSLQWRMSHY